MTSDYERRRAAHAKRLQDEEQAERQKEIILGETSGKVEKDIRSGQELKVKIRDVNDLLLTPSNDLKKGDILKITIKADPSLSEEHKLSWGREKPSRSDEASGTVKGKIKVNQDIDLKIDRIELKKVQSSVELDKGDSIRIIVEKS
ncbi:MAG TPA: hypothetical protein G4O15_06975 [Dehalococcoidia bacterium]|nr:hypothetical protein [Dehalococcoidia bacterium]